MAAVTTPSVTNVRDKLINAATGKSTKDAHRKCTNHFVTFAVNQLNCPSTHPSLADYDITGNHRGYHASKSNVGTSSNSRFKPY